MLSRSLITMDMLWNRIYVTNINGISFSYDVYIIHSKFFRKYYTEYLTSFRVWIIQKYGHKIRCDDHQSWVERLVYL